MEAPSIAFHTSNLVQLHAAEQLVLEPSAALPIEIEVFIVKKLRNAFRQDS